MMGWGVFGVAVGSYPSGRISGSMEATFDKVKNNGQEGEEDDGDDNERKVVFDNGHITKEVTGKSKQTYPDNASKDVVGNKFGVVHFANAGDKGGKGADDGHEASQK